MDTFIIYTNGALKVELIYILQNLLEPTEGHQLSFLKLIILFRILLIT